MNLMKVEKEITYYHGKCDIDYKSKNGLIFLKVNDLVIFNNTSKINAASQPINLEVGLDKAYDIMVRSPQLITVHGYSKLVTENSHPSTLIPPLTLLRSLGVLKINTVDGIIYTLDGNFEYTTITRTYNSYDEIDWSDWYGIYTICQEDNIYKVRGLLKKPTEIIGIHDM